MRLRPRWQKNGVMNLAAELHVIVGAGPVPMAPSSRQPSTTRRSHSQRHWARLADAGSSSEVAGATLSSRYRSKLSYGSGL